jgi:uncharacterized protein YjbI with pentapeptide repeats
MVAFSISNLTVSPSALSALRSIAQNLTVTQQAFRAAPQPATPAAQSITDRLRDQLNANRVQQEALAQSSAIVNVSIRGLTDITKTLNNLRQIVTSAAQPGVTNDQLQSLSQQFNQGLDSLKSTLNAAGFGGVNLLNGTNVQGFLAKGLGNNDLQTLNVQSGVVDFLSANSLQNALSGGGNRFQDLINRIEQTVKTDVGQASDTTIASFANQFVNQAGTSDPSRVFSLGNSLITTLNGTSTTDRQNQRLVGRILDSIGDNVPQAQTTVLINQLIGNLSNQAPPPSVTNLKGADFEGANLQGVNFAGVDLTGANFEGANLQGANFAGANLNGANFEGANLQNANLQGASTQDAFFRHANLHGTILQNNPPPSVSEPGFQEPPRPTGQDFERQNLTGGNFAGQNLAGADFERSRLQGATFANTILSGASFERANAQGVNFGGADLARADFAGANLQGANFQAPQPSGGGGGGNGGGGSGGPDFATVLGAVDKALSTVGKGLDILNREAKSIKDQASSLNDLNQTLNSQVGSLVTTNVTTERAQVLALQIARDLGQQIIGITGERAKSIINTLLDNGRSAGGSAFSTNALQTLSATAAGAGNSGNPSNPGNPFPNLLSPPPQNNLFNIQA